MQYLPVPPIEDHGDLTDPRPVTTWTALAGALGADRRTMKAKVLALPEHLRCPLSGTGKPYLASASAAREWWSAVHAPPEPPEPRKRKARRATKATAGHEALADGWLAALDAI